MAKYNTFVLINCKNKKTIVVTSSARKAKQLIKTGVRVEVWNENAKVDVLYAAKKEGMNKYLAEERAYIKNKQDIAAERCDRRWTPSLNTQSG